MSQDVTQEVLLQDESIVVASVDLGSNSFHMLVTRSGESGWQVLDRIRESVRLADGLAKDKSLLPDAEERALECLARFGERLKDLPRHRVRVVGTNTLRRLRRSRGFISRAEAVLGHRIEIIAGVEEARLIYGGVTHGLPLDGSRRLVVDIGGGSTELIVGGDGGPHRMESVHMGCVSFTRQYFPDGDITRKRVRQARLAARTAVKFLARDYRNHGWDVALGASGSIRAVWRVAAAMGLGEHAISRKAVEAVIEACIEAGHVDNLNFPDLRDDRQPVFIGSACVLAGVFDSLAIDRMEVSDRALREGVIYDLLGRLSDHDVRDRSAAALVERFQLDHEHAARVERLASQLRAQVAVAWDLGDDLYQDSLRWAAQLHEIGMSISHSGYHKHSAYVLAHLDLHGFSRTDQHILAAVVRCHRGNWSNDRFDDLPKNWRTPARRLAILLRVAVILARGRNPAEMPELNARASKGYLHLSLPSGWLVEHALTRTDLELDAVRLAKAGFTLEFE